MEERSHRLRALLILAESDMRWFLASSPEAREHFRNYIVNVQDLGYFSSLVSVLAEEKALERWKQFSTLHFNGLGQKGVIA